MKYALRDFTDAIECLLRDREKKTVTVFCHPLSNIQYRIRVTRKFKPRTADRINEFIVTYGKPNYAEREFLSQCKKENSKPRRFLFKFFKSKVQYTYPD